MSRPYLIATMGYPGSGKTHFSENLALREGFVHLNADRERFRLFKKPQYTKKEHLALSEAMDRTAEELLRQSKSVIYDVNFNKRIHRDRVRGIAERTDAEYLLVHVVTSESVALERLKVRGKNGSQDSELYRPIDLEIFHRMKGQVEVPDESEPVIKLDGGASFEKQLAQFKESL